MLTRRAGYLLALLLLVCRISSAQTVDTRPLRGFMPTSDQVSSPIDSIDTVNGNLHLQIPLASLPVGRGGSGFDLDLGYDSHIYDLQYYFTDGSEKLTPNLTTGNWNYSIDNFKLDQEYRVSNPCYNGRDYRLRIGLPDGSLHILHLKGFGDEISDNYAADGFYALDLNGVRSDCAKTHTNWYPQDVLNSKLTYYTTDGSFLKFEIPTAMEGFPDIGRQAPGTNTLILSLLSGFWLDINKPCNPGETAEGDCAADIAVRSSRVRKDSQRLE